MISIYIDSIDKSSIIEMGSVVKQDNLNQQVDILMFDVIYHAGQTYRPATNSEVELYDGAVKIFAGRIYMIEKQREDDNKVRYKIKCKDYSYDLDRQLVVEGYEDKTVNYIIDDILINFTDGSFTDNNVDCAIEITKITFDRITITEALQRLAELTGYSWYVDEDKDIHFFEKNTESAPTDITENDGNYIPSTMKIIDDISQIRNRVFIKGGEIEGSVREETFDGDGNKKLFSLATKFASKPTVEVEGTPQDVGVDFLDNEDDFDCFWDFNQKSLRFKVSPTEGSNNISVEGIPLYNLVVQVSDPTSILEYGVFEFAKTDTELKSREEAVSFAKAQLTAYKNGVLEGSFNTYTSGFRSGQIININISSLDVSEDFLIQNVNFTMISKDVYYYQIQIATLKTIGIIDFLIGLLKIENKIIGDKGDVVLEKTEFPLENIEFSEDIDINTDDVPKTEEIEFQETATVQALDYPTIFVLGDNNNPTPPNGYKRVFILGGSRLGSD